jgi:hypothetical protein
MPHSYLSCLSEYSFLLGLLTLNACTTTSSWVTGQQPGTPPPASPPSNVRGQPFFMPGSGKGLIVFSDDRTTCTYAVHPWTTQGFTECMVARGNRAFEWSQTKSQAELASDKMQCASNQEEESFDNCLLARTDLIPINVQASSGPTYARLRQPPPATMCSNFARGNVRMFTDCMNMQRCDSIDYCMEASNKQEPQYIQCMASRGYTVSGLPQAETHGLASTLFSPIPMPGGLSGELPGLPSSLPLRMSYSRRA